MAISNDDNDNNNTIITMNNVLASMNTLHFLERHYKIIGFDPHFSSSKVHNVNENRKHNSLRGLSSNC